MGSGRNVFRMSMDMYELVRKATAVDLEPFWTVSVTSIPHWKGTTTTFTGPTEQYHDLRGMLRENVAVRVWKAGRGR